MIKRLSFTILILILIIFSFSTLAQGVYAFSWLDESGLSKTKTVAGYTDSNTGEGDIVSTISLVIRIFLSFLGVIFLILTIYAGFIWMFSRGNESDIEKAKKILQNAIIGLIVILLAYSLTVLFGAIFSTPQM